MSPFTEDDFMDNSPRTRDSELRGRMEGLRDERERLAPGVSQLFESVLERYLEGELNYDEAGMFVADMDLDESQERVWQSLRNLEDTLIIRADVASQLDWLSQRVREAVENNEQLRHWLREISRGVLTFHVWQGHDEYQSLIKCTRLAYIGKYLGVSGGVAVLRSDIS